MTTIREAVITSLTAIYHARIDYPGFNPPPLTSGLAQLPRPELDTEERGVSYNRTSEIPINKAGEVEDEAIPRGAFEALGWVGRISYLGTSRVSSFSRRSTTSS